MCVLAVKIKKKYIKIMNSAVEYMLHLYAHSKNWTTLMYHSSLNLSVWGYITFLPLGKCY